MSLLLEQGKSCFLPGLERLGTRQEFRGNCSFYSPKLGSFKYFGFFFFFFTFLLLSKISFLVFQLKTGFIMSCASSKSFFSIGQSPKRVRTTALLIFTKQINHVSLYISFRQIAKIRFRFLFSPGKLRYSGGPYAVLFDGRLLLDAGRGNLPLPVYCKGLQRWQQVKNVPWNFMG